MRPVGDWREMNTRRCQIVYADLTRLFARYTT